MPICRACCAAAAALLTSCTALPPVSAGGTVQPPTSSTPTTPVSSAASDNQRIEREIAAELNAARSNPSGYSKYLSDMLSQFDGTLRRRPGQVPIRTTEGAAAVREAISALARQAPVPAMTFNDRLSLAARDLARDQGRTGQLGHTGSDGSTPATRISRYGTWGGSYSENVNYGASASGRDVVLDLIVDDGVPSRGHRKNIFDPTARVVGVACGPHPKYGTVCVIDQAGSFVAK